MVIVFAWLTLVEYAQERTPLPSGFEAGKQIPTICTYKGAEKLRELFWQHVPPQNKTFALIIDGDRSFSEKIASLIFAHGISGIRIVD